LSGSSEPSTAIFGISHVATPVARDHRIDANCVPSEVNVVSMSPLSPVTLVALTEPTNAVVA
jgi:hypothetical protein